MPASAGSRESNGAVLGAGKTLAICHLFCSPEPTWNSTWFQKQNEELTPNPSPRHPSYSDFESQVTVFSKQKKHKAGGKSGERRQKEERNNSTWGGGAGKKTCSTPRSLPYDTSFLKHCAQEEGFVHCLTGVGINYGLAVCWRKVQTWIYTITLLKQTFASVFTHIKWNHQMYQMLTFSLMNYQIFPETWVIMSFTTLQKKKKTLNLSPCNSKIIKILLKSYTGEAEKWMIFSS